MDYISLYRFSVEHEVNFQNQIINIMSFSSRFSKIIFYSVVQFFGKW
jgi:hypothetical protein